MKSKEFRLSSEQAQALERIARDNHARPADLVSLAVDALIAEASLHQGWLPLPNVRRESPLRPPDGEPA